MKKQQGFTLIELLIVVAIIAIIAAIAVPNLLTARMAANETSAVGALRAIGSAQISYSVSNQLYAEDINDLVTGDFLDGRFATDGTINGYFLGELDSAITNPSSSSNEVAPFTVDVFGYGAAPITAGTTGRYCYGIGADMVIRYIETVNSNGGECDAKYPNGFSEGQPVGGKSGTASAS